jgi:hypothetical protein
MKNGKLRGINDHTLRQALENHKANIGGTIMHLRLHKRWLRYLIYFTILQLGFDVAIAGRVLNVW